MGRADYWQPHSHNVICDRCGFKVKRAQAKMEWTGLFVCDASVNNCWEPRNSLDFVRNVPDRQSVFPTRPDADLPYIEAIADIGIAGLCLAGDDPV
jgi:hypothetical protein